MISVDITEQEAPQRVDRFLNKYLNLAPKSVVFRLLRKKIIRVNGKRSLQRDDIRDNIIGLEFVWEK